jgi:hypothetical protein
VAGAVTLDAIRLFVALVAVAAVVAIIVRRLAIPYRVTLVVLGLVTAELVLKRAGRVPPAPAVAGPEPAAATPKR